MATNSDESTTAIAVVIVILIGGIGLWFFWHPIVVIVSTALQMSMMAVSLALSAAISIILAVLVILFGFWCLEFLIERIGKQVTDLRNSISFEARQAGMDATFIALLSVLCAAIAYMATDDFVDKFSTIRLLAVCGVGFCIAKLSIMLPSRVAKASGIALTAVLLTCCILFLNHRYDIENDAWTGFRRMHDFIFPSDPELASKQIIRLTIATTIALLSGLAISYPFSPKKWKSMLTIIDGPPAEA